MSSERWVLVGPADDSVLTPLKKAIQKAGHRTTLVSSVEECAETTARRTFLCAFFNAPFLPKAEKKCPFQVPTYTVLVTQPAETQRALCSKANRRFTTG
jgi:hypothetical protein